MYLSADRSVAVWRCESEISQGRLGGRDGSNACTLIAIVLGRMFCRNESQLSVAFKKGTSPLKTSWLHALVNAIVDGNTIYDKHISLKSPCYLDVETACSLAESELKVARISEPLPVWFNSDFEDAPLATVEYQLLLFSLNEGRKCTILTSNGKSSVILSEGMGKLLLIDTHNDVLSNCGSKVVMGNVQQVSQFLKSEVYKFPENQRYGVLTQIEFLP